MFLQRLRERIRMFHRCRVHFIRPSDDHRRRSTVTVFSKPVWVRVIGLLLLCLCLSGAASFAMAAVLPSLEIPPELSRWNSWVLYGMEEKLCPARYNDSEASA
jgi:hypothetical protein